MSQNVLSNIKTVIIETNSVLSTDISHKTYKGLNQTLHEINGVVGLETQKRICVKFKPSGKTDQEIVDDIQRASASIDMALIQYRVLDIDKKNQEEAA